MRLFFRELRGKRGLLGALALVATVSAFLLVIGCSDDDDDDDGGRISFSGVNVPVTDAEKRSILASPAATVNGRDHKIGYNVLMRSGDVIGSGTFGMIYDQTGQTARAEDGSVFISSDNDFSSLLPVGGKLFNVTHFESRPGAMYLTELNQDKDTGSLSPVRTMSIDFSAFGGLWVPCAGSVTPWGTHLGSEEYPPDAREHEEATSADDIPDYDKDMLRYFGIVNPWGDDVTLSQIRNLFNSYKYGYPVEVEVREDMTYTVNKRYAMGRVALELAYVMPDRKTAYMSDDGTNVGFFMFVADEENDLSSGKLYAAQWNQTGTENGGSADIKWIDLGHAEEASIKSAIDNGTKFFDIFEAAEPNADNTCPEGYASMNAEDAGHECLKVKPGMEMIASRLETRRYADSLGATTEFRKEEGITYDPDKNLLYVAMSEVNSGMEDFKRSGSDNDRYDKGGPNHIRLPYNNCGCVYQLEVGSDDAIGSDYVVKNTSGMICGIMTEYPDDSPYAGNKCDVDGIANPDNITYLPGYNTLIIGEDTGSGHQNDVVWAYDTETGALSRIQTTPYGSETTSPYFYPNVNGWAYIMSVIQHPYGESDRDKLADASDARAYVGYIGPLPKMD